MQMFWYVVMLPHFCLMNNEMGKILCPVILKKAARLIPVSCICFLIYVWLQHRDRFFDEENR